MDTQRTKIKEKIKICTDEHLENHINETGRQEKQVTEISQECNKNKRRDLRKR